MNPRRLLGVTAGVLMALTGSGRAAASPSPQARPRVHVVRPGDTVWGIARSHGMKPDVLARANVLENPHQLRIGASLRIPGSDEPLPRASSSSARRVLRPRMDWPSRGTVTSRFGYRGKRHHDGIDIAAPVGTPISASRDGIVRFTGLQAGYGRLVILDHGNGLTTWYGHASKILVQVGQQVEKGSVIALVGTSGDVTGPNLHFEVRRNNVPLNPVPFLTRRRK